MGFSGFQAGVMVRVAGLLAILTLLAWLAVRTDWYVAIGICATAAVSQAVVLTRYASRAGREIAHFLDTIAFGDTSASFAALSRDTTFGALATAMGRVMDQLRSGQAQREEQSQYLQSLLAHIPVALISVDAHGTVQQLNLAARRLFAAPCATVAGFVRYGESFATVLEVLKPGETAILRMDCGQGSLQLKAAATDIVLGGVRRRLISLQNIETELNSQELAAWQSVIRVIAHEVVNSLTPISSLAATARTRLQESLAQVAPGSPHRAGLEDACEALDALTRRSDGLLHFVQNHRRLTRRMVPQAQVVPVRRIFARLQRLLAEELKQRDIDLIARVKPETLEVTVDADLLDQALINLMRNAMDALRDKPLGEISLSAVQGAAGRPIITVADNGPGIPPDQREKVFVPFYTTKREGSGVGLTLVRQIAAVHGAAVTISDTPNGGTSVNLLF